MDILSLPDVFLHKLMRTMEIKDRLRLRLTCRAFEQLVADSHAGYFERGHIHSFRKMHSSKKHFQLQIGDRRFGRAGTKKFELTEDDMKPFLVLRSRLFRGISIGEFEFQGAGLWISMIDFTEQLTDNFKIARIHFEVRNKFELDRASQIISSNPSSKCTMAISLPPSKVNDDKLATLPNLETLKIYYKLPVDLPHLLAPHKNLIYCTPSVIKPDRWEEILQMLSSGTQGRTVCLKEKHTILVTWLLEIGFSEDSEIGSSRIEFTLSERLDNWAKFVLCYRKSWIHVEEFSWRDIFTSIDCDVTMGNEQTFRKE